MTYSFYLFCRLREVILPSELEYDLQFESDIELYNQYFVSQYNDENIGEYQCIVNYINSLKNPS